LKSSEINLKMVKPTSPIKIFEQNINTYKRGNTLKEEDFDSNKSLNKIYNKVPAKAPLANNGGTTF